MDFKEELLKDQLRASTATERQAGGLIEPIEEDCRAQLSKCRIPKVRTRGPEGGMENFSNGPRQAVEMGSRSSGDTEVFCQLVPGCPQQMFDDRLVRSFP